MGNPSYKRAMSSTTKTPVSTQIVNVPNVLTALRLVLSIVVFALIGTGHYAAALVTFVVAAGTDWVDGYWARKYGQVTQLGRIFDPFVDKIIICGTFTFLCSAPGSGMPAWVVVVVFGREMLVTSLRSALEQRGVDFSASWSGKLKMGFQCAAVVGSLLALKFGTASSQTLWYGTATDVPAWIHYGLLAAVWTTVISTVQSGAEYVAKAARLMRG
jgi:CDP-diacylglycerol--glycerol-3-phosphate 3-phosphatidyltransferase